MIWVSCLSFSGVYGNLVDDWTAVKGIGDAVIVFSFCFPCACAFFVVVCCFCFVRFNKVCFAIAAAASPFPAWIKLKTYISISLMAFWSLHLNSIRPSFSCFCRCLIGVEYHNAFMWPEVWRFFLFLYFFLKWSNCQMAYKMKPTAMTRKQTKWKWKNKNKRDQNQSKSDQARPDQWSEKCNQEWILLFLGFLIFWNVPKTVKMFEFQTAASSNISRSLHCEYEKNDSIRNCAHHMHMNQYEFPSNIFEIPMHRLSI